MSVRTDHINISRPNRGMTGLSIEKQFNHEQYYNSTKHRSKTPWIGIGPNNRLYDKMLDIISRSNIASRCIENLTQYSNTKMTFVTENDQERLKCEELERVFHLDVVSHKIMRDYFSYGGFTPVTSFGELDLSKKRHQRISVNLPEGFSAPFVPLTASNYTIRKIRFEKGVDDGFIKGYPQNIYLSDSWGLWYGDKHVGSKRVSNAIKIGGTSEPDWMYDIEMKSGEPNETATAKVYFARHIGSFLNYYPLPCSYHNDPALHAAYRDSQVAHLKSNLVDNGMYSHFVAIINRDEYEDEDWDEESGEIHPEMEARADEKEIIRRNIGVDSAGSIPIVWAPLQGRTKDSPAYIQFEEFPQIKNVEMYEFLTKSNLETLRIAFGIGHACFIGATGNDGGSLNNNAHNIMIALDNMNETIIIPAQRLRAKFYRWFFNDCLGFNIREFVPEEMSMIKKVRATLMKDSEKLDKEEKNTTKV